MATYKNSSFYSEEVFKGTDSITYSRPTGLQYKIYTIPYTTTLFIDVAAVKTENVSQ